MVGARVVALFPNHTWVAAHTDEHGSARTHLHSTHLPMTALAAALGFSGRVVRNWVPAQRGLALELERLPRGGSTILLDGEGDIPPISGRLEIVLDDFGRIRLYTSGAIINDGQSQPVSFALGQDLRLTDSYGRRSIVRIVEVAGRSALVDYMPA